MSETVSSTSDGRTTNNTFRHQYRILSEAEKQNMQAIKDKGADFLELLHSVGGTAPSLGRLSSRELSLAQTKIEEAVMWAVKHVTA